VSFWYLLSSHHEIGQAFRRHWSEEKSEVLAEKSEEITRKT
jgi:hypothetical protein